MKKKFLTLINNERTNIKTISAKGCDGASVDNCFVWDKGDCTDGASDICNKDIGECGFKAKDICISGQYDLTDCFGPGVVDDVSAGTLP